MKFAISYSGGKDCALATYRMIAAGHTPVALITTLSAGQDRSWFHGIPKDLLEAVSDSMEIPLIACACDPEQYTQAYEQGLAKVREMGVRACVFGDIDIDDHKRWNEARCEAAGLDCILPLWGQNREALVRETIEAGFRAMIKIVQSDQLDESFLGKDLTGELVEKIQAAGCDVCGENGEYHTFVHGGPIFKRPIPLKIGEVVDLGRHKAIDISLAQPK